MKTVASLYAADGGAGLAYPPLDGPVRADVAIVGAGLTGLSTALHLAEQGASVIVLEAEQPGWGASGRNGGQVNPGLKPLPDEVEKEFGPVHGPALVDAAWNAPNRVFELIERHAIDCAAQRGGTLRAATAPVQIAPLRELTRQCLERGWPVQWLEPEEMQARTGTSLYCGGMLDMRGGQLDPLAYTRGLARAATQAGATIYGATRVTSFARKEGAWHVQTGAGSVVAQRLVFATNGYTDKAWDKLRRSVVPVFSGIVASSPLSDALAERILSQHEVLYELGQITTYYRVDAHKRLLMGGRSYSHDLQGALAFPYLVQRALFLWPELQDVGWTHGWNGQLGITLDHYPHWHEPDAGLLACLGYNGRGVAMATVMGQHLANYLSGAGVPLFPPSPIKPIAGHFAWKAGVAGRILWGRLSDRLGLPF
ncbi:FAD-dependent oxidoreductase [Acetobacter senegalensis]|uniref:FAD-dependent oxidoreductase n=2 Tax=Acetobacter TaxID=434 RepID=A0A252EHC1_9PROT|nr:MULTISPECIES: FAD-binding oxidoreductase [Acetobacter]ATJ89635.1 FAD-binding oxidoreductase [Acetobacter tropicalis]OUL65807.1 FAD-dependent oxidoreductase [Acetobacter senegalensis]